MNRLFLINDLKGGAIETKGDDARKPNENLRRLAKLYMELHDYEYIENLNYPQVNEKLAKEIANYYENAPLIDYDYKPVIKSYLALCIQTLDQYNFLINDGYTFTPYKDTPYKYLSDVYKDVRDNKHLYFYVGGDMSNYHPLKVDTNIKIDGHLLNYNDVFRVVHDIFGHCKEGAQFGARGEEFAYRQHYLLYTPIARPALTTETRGQNSWVNYHPKALDNDYDKFGNIISYGNREKKGSKYAEQKVILLPNKYIGLYENL
jgi:hypothetical protein